MSSLLDRVDQVDVRVARARRALTRSKNIIVAAREDLDIHQRWMDRHRVAWGKDLERYQRLLNRNPAIWEFMRLAFGVILLVPFACIALLRRILPYLRDLVAVGCPRVGVFTHALRRSLKERRSQVLLRLGLANIAHDATGTGRHELQDRISRLDGQLWNRKADAPSRVTPNTRCNAQMWEERSPVRNSNSGGFRAFAPLPDLMEGRGFAWAFGVISVTLIAAGAVRATMPGLPTETHVSLAPKVPTPTRPAAALPTTVSTAPVRMPAPSPVSFSGFSVVATAVPEPLSLPAQTIASMMFITSPVALAPTEPDAAIAPVAEESLAAKPKVTPERKRKLTRQEPQQQLPWWRRLPWIQVR